MISNTTEPLIKEAILAKLLRLGATPIPGTPKMLMKLRTLPELNQLETATRGKLRSVINEPIERGLRAVGAEPFINKYVGKPVTTLRHKMLPEFIKATAPDIAEKMPSLAQVKAPQELEHLSNAFGNKIIQAVSNNPEILALQASPVPGTTESYLLTKAFLKKKLGIK